MCGIIPPRCRDRNTNKGFIMSINRHTQGAAASWSSIFLAGLHGGYMLSLSQSGCSTCFTRLYRAGRQSAIWALQAARRGPNPGPSFAVRNRLLIFLKISTAPKIKIDNYSRKTRKMSVNSIRDINGTFLGFVFLSQASRHKTTRSIEKSRQIRQQIASKHPVQIMRW